MWNACLFTNRVPCRDLIGKKALEFAGRTGLYDKSRFQKARLDFVLRNNLSNQCVGLPDKRIRRPRWERDAVSAGNFVIKAAFLHCRYVWQFRVACSCRHGQCAKITSLNLTDHCADHFDQHVNFAESKAAVASGVF